MPTILTQTYSTNTAIALDISSLATSGSLVSGRASTQIDNSSTNYDDVIVNVKGINGHASTAPTIGQYIGLWVYGSDLTVGSNNIDTISGTDGNFTLGHVSVLNSLRFAAAPTVTAANANLKYWIMPFSVAALFGGSMPRYWGLYLSHNHTGALAASQSGLFSFAGVTYTAT